MCKFGFLSEELENLKKIDSLRKLRVVESVEGVHARFSGGDGTAKILLCSNDYLNLSGHARVISAVTECVENSGFGSGASRLVCGTRSEHAALEGEFAEFFGKEAALLFPSGWSANESLLQTIPQKNDLVLIDKLDHASIIDGVRDGEADFRTFRRDDMKRLEKLLGSRKYTRKFIVTESVFSMDGDRADLKRLVELKNKYDAILIVDEAHALGCFGPNGEGLAAEDALLGEVDIIVAPLGKAFAASGAIIAGPQPVIDYLINKARPFIYTTAPPIPNCAAISAALNIIRTEPHRRSKLHENATYLRSKLVEAGLDIGNSTTQIIPVIIGGDSETVRVSEMLFERGFFAIAIRPPTVAVGSARLRLSVQCEHTTEQLDDFVGVLCDVIKR
jgi:8-amino-7-oxononanoate synthase